MTNSDDELVEAIRVAISASGADCASCCKLYCPCKEIAVVALDVARHAIRNAALDESLRAVRNCEEGSDCEYNRGLGGPDDGCSHRGDCLCAHWNEALEKVETKLKALKEPAHDRD